MKVLMAKDLETAKRLSGERTPVVTVECEYGLEVIEGQLHTMAHHVAGWETAPSLQMNIGSFEYEAEDYIMISHIDLDTICGIMAATGRYYVSESIKAGVNYVDCNGQHHLFDKEVSDFARRFIFSYIGYCNKNRAPFGVEDVTEYVETLIEKFNTVKNYEAGKAFVEGRRAEAEAGLVSSMGTVGIILQEATSSTFGLNSEYMLNDKEFDYIIVYSDKFKSITMSSRLGSADTRNMADIMRAVFGPEAGGHKGIAGTPRGKEFSLVDAEKLLQVMTTLIY